MKNEEFEMNHGSYRELLFDKRWLEKRAEIIKRDNYCCRICGSMDDLTVHHKQYHINAKTNEKNYPWDYDDKYLVTLCKNCHQRGHAKYKVPRKFINK